MARILLDNCVPVRFAKFLTGHTVVHAQKMGWDKLLDGPLLSLAEHNFDLIVTVDKSMQFQQRITGRGFAVIVLRAKRNTVSKLEPLVPQLLVAIANVQPGEVREITAP